MGIFDPRLKDPKVKEIDNLQCSWGTRTLEWHGSCLISGGGMGKITVFDIRADAYIPMPFSRNFIPISSGWVRQDASFQAISEVLGHAIPTSIYALAFNDSRTQLVACGGPTQFGLHGSYMGIFRF